MKPKRIITSDVTETHPDFVTYDTDPYYTRLANRLQDGMFKCDIQIDKFVACVIRKASIALANYLEDIVADCGVWRLFSHLCQQLYGHPVPLFHEPEEYYPDEPSLNAVRYIIWNATYEVSDEEIYANNSALETLATVAYGILEEAFEEAPINDELCEDINHMLQHTCNDFDSLRMTLYWLLDNCYLTSGIYSEKMLHKYAEKAWNQKGATDLYDSPLKAIYYASTHCSFATRLGPLALYPKEYLAALMRLKGMDTQANDVEQIEIIPSNYYKYEYIAPERLLLTHTDGRQLELDTLEMNMEDNILKEHDGCIVSSFVLFQGEWHLNGSVIVKKIGDDWDDICKKYANDTDTNTAGLTYEDMLKINDGKRLIYFSNQKQLYSYWEEKFKPMKCDLPLKDMHDYGKPLMFIGDEKPKSCVHLIFGYSAYIADPNNPFYDPEIAREDSVSILYNSEDVSTNFVEYLLDQGFLPDLYKGDLLSNNCSPKQRRYDIDFLMRTLRREDY